MSSGIGVVDEFGFRDAVNARAGALLDVASRLCAVDAADPDAARALLTRPTLALILSHASQVEELLDAHGALGNERWRPFRGFVAAMKVFARVDYALVHLFDAVPRYRLLSADDGLAEALLDARRFTARVLCTASRRLAAAAASLALAPRPVELHDELPSAGLLPQDCARRRIGNVEGTVARLASAFLNLAVEARALTAAASGGDEPPTLPAESDLRRLAEDFHNLQALYDTHVAHTDVEGADPELVSLRGYASVLFHLLEIATDLTHYRERHVLHAPAVSGPGRVFARQPDCIDPEHLEVVLRDATLAFVNRFVQAGRTHAQQLLRRYAEQGEITVPVPRYRGFHVRPSTLVARVAHHYGSPVSMTIDGETYDASSPFELFRANEQINARKRRSLAQEISKLVDHGDDRLGEDVVRAVRNVLMRLAEEAKVILYEQPLPPVEGQLGEGQPVLSFIVDAVARLQALGKIDIVATVPATFRGDRRVLADLELLASTGYGEDAYGNNVALPPQLSYLRR